MKNCLYILFSGLISLVISTGCIRPDAVKVLGISDVNVSLKGTPAVNFVLNAENTSGRNITLSNATLEISDVDNGRIARIIVGSNILLPKRSITNVNVPLRLSIDNPLAGMALLGNLEKSIKSLYVSGSVTVKAGCLRKNITIDRMLLTDFINRFGGQDVLSDYMAA